MTTNLTFKNVKFFKNNMNKIVVVVNIDINIIFNEKFVDSQYFFNFNIINSRIF